MNPTTVLLVDDDVDFIAQNRRALETAGFRVVEAHDGDEGFKVAQATPPDVIIVDVMMRTAHEGFEIWPAVFAARSVSRRSRCSCSRPSTRRVARRASQSTSPTPIATKRGSRSTASSTSPSPPTSSLRWCDSSRPSRSADAPVLNLCTHPSRARAARGRRAPLSTARGRMTTCSYPIEGGDYDHAGSACRGLKEVVEALGVDPEAMRRLMIAAYEAEMNVVIHARQGRLTAIIEPGHIGAEVADEGPGIADIDLAMTEGFSTAPAAARSLGFGAGMGLPNIRRQSDDFSIESEVGRGTRLRFGVRLGPSTAVEARHNSLRVRGERCRLCCRCVTACPTGALRVRHGGVSVLAHLCIECTECVGVCPDAALDVEGDGGAAPVRAETLVAAPAALFPGGVPMASDTVARAIAASGYRHVRLTTPWERSLRRLLADAPRRPLRPVLSPACPAVVELLRVRFPSLLEDVLNVLGPLEAAAAANPDADVLPLCPAGRSALVARDVQAGRIVSPAVFRRRLLSASKVRTGEGTHRATPERPSVEPDRDSDPVAVVTGLRQVVRTLGALEDGRLRGPAAIELLRVRGRVLRLRFAGRAMCGARRADIPQRPTLLRLVSRAARVDPEALCPQRLPPRRRHGAGDEEARRHRRPARSPSRSRLRPVRSPELQRVRRGRRARTRRREGMSASH